jgi:succinyl-CoA synthetase alpha subunit
VDKTGADASVIFVPPPFAADAIMEAADAEIELSSALRRYSRLDMGKHGSSCRRAGTSDRAQLPGDHSPGKCKIGIMPGRIHKEGNVGIVSRSGTLTYEAVHQLTTVASDNPLRSGLAVTQLLEPILWMLSTCSIAILKPKPS